MAEPRAGCAGSLIKVAGILMQQRREDCATDHDVGKTISRRYAKPFPKSPRALRIIGAIHCLPQTSDKSNSRKRDRIVRHLEGEVEFHFRCERRGILSFKGVVKFGNDAEDALRLFDFELLSRILDGIILNLHRSVLGRDAKRDASKGLNLPRFKGD